MIQMNQRFLFPFFGGGNIFILSHLWVIFSLTELECSLFTWLWFEISLSCGRSGTDASLLTSLCKTSLITCWDAHGRCRTRLQHLQHSQLCPFSHFLSVGHTAAKFGSKAISDGTDPHGWMPRCGSRSWAARMPHPSAVCWAARMPHPCALGSVLSRRSHAAICRGGTAGTAFTAAPLRPEWGKCFRRSKFPSRFPILERLHSGSCVYIYICSGYIYIYYIYLFQCCHPHSNLE